MTEFCAALLTAFTIVISLRVVWHLGSLLGSAAEFVDLAVRAAKKEDEE